MNKETIGNIFTPAELAFLNDGKLDVPLGTEITIKGVIYNIGGYRLFVCFLKQATALGYRTLVQVIFSGKPMTVAKKKYKTQPWYSATVKIGEHKHKNEHKHKTE